jgi:hypothetical protein
MWDGHDLISALNREIAISFRNCARNKTTLFENCSIASGRAVFETETP